MPGSQSLLCRTDTKIPEGLRCFVYLTPGSSPLFKIKNGIVFGVQLLGYFSLTLHRRGRNQGMELKDSGGEAGLSGRKSRPGNDSAQRHGGARTEVVCAAVSSAAVTARAPGPA